MDTVARKFNVDGITWHAITLDEAKFDEYRQMLDTVMGVQPIMEQEGFALFQFSNGSMLELYLPNKVPAYGYNGAVAFGFRVSDIAAAAEALKDAGFKVYDITRIPEMKYAYCHFEGPDGIIYGMNEQTK